MSHKLAHKMKRSVISCSYRFVCHMVFVCCFCPLIRRKLFTLCINAVDLFTHTHTRFALFHSTKVSPKNFGFYDDLIVVSDKLWTLAAIMSSSCNMFSAWKGASKCIETHTKKTKLSTISILEYRCANTH